jgi:hypothetical protein
MDHVELDCDGVNWMRTGSGLVPVTSYFVDCAEALGLIAEALSELNIYRLTRV